MGNQPLQFIKKSSASEKAAAIRKRIDAEFITILEIAYQAIQEDSRSYDQIADKLDLSESALADLRNLLGESLGEKSPLVTS